MMTDTHSYPGYALRAYPGYVNDVGARRLPLW